MAYVLYNAFRLKKISFLDRIFVLYKNWGMKNSIFILLFMFFSSFSSANPNSKKLGELPRSSELDKEITSLIPKAIKDWKTLSEELLGPKKIFRAKSKKFTIESGPEEVYGDLARYTFHLSKDGKKTRLGKEPLAWVQVSPDERYILFESFTAMNTEDWSIQDLTKLLEDPGYIKVLKYSPSTKKLIVANFACATDCDKTDKYTILEISLE